MARKTTTHFDDTNGKDLVYGIVLTEALNVLSQDKRRSQSLADDHLRQDRLLDIKNLLDDIFLAGHKRNSNEYRLWLYKKIVVEKLILNVLSGNKNDIRQNIVQLFAEEKIPFIHRCESLISAEDKFLIKTDFHGLANYPLKEQLSTYFQSVVAHKDEPKVHDYPSEAFDLNKIPCWEKMQQFSSFHKQEENFRKALAEARISPKRLKKLNAFDMVALLKHYHAKHNLNSFESRKSKFIRYFIKIYEKDFRTYLAENKELMKFALANRGIKIDERKNPSAYNEYVEKTIRDMKKKGVVPPLFNIHHKEAVKDCGERNLSDSSHWKNLTLVLEVPYHNLFHILDKKDRRLILPSNVIFWGGMMKSNQITYREDEEYMQKLIALAKKNRGGY